MNEESAFSDLEEIKKIFDTFGIPFFLCCGTLLGAYRDGEFLPDDKDIDIGIIGRHKRELVKDILIENGFSVVQYNPKFIGFHLSIRKNVFIDVHFFDKEGGSYQCYVKYQKPCIGFPDRFGNFKKFTFKGLKFDIPILTEEYLTNTYGDWKDKTNRRSAKQYG